LLWRVKFSSAAFARVGLADVRHSRARKTFSRIRGRVSVWLTSGYLARLHPGNRSALLEGGAAALLCRKYPRLGGYLYPLLVSGVAGLYIGAAKLGIELPVARGIVTPVWAPAGIALAALVLFGPSLWPAIAIGALVANATSGASLPVAAGISVGNTLEAVVGAALLRRVDFRPSIDRVRDVAGLVLLAAAASTAIAATNGVTILWATGNLSDSYASSWFLWWSGDAMGDLVVAPVLLVWLSAPFWKPRRAELLEGLGLLALLAGLSWFVFLHGSWRYPHLLFPLLVWASLRFYQRGAATSSFVVAAFAIAGAVNGSTPLGGNSPTEVVQIEEGLLAALIVSLLILGAVLSERAAAEIALQRERANFAEAQEVAHIGSWEWDVAENRTTWSEELFRLYELEPAPDVDYGSYLAHIHPEDRERVNRQIRRALLSSEPFSVEHRIVLANGTVRWMHARGHVVDDASGNPVRFVGTSQDITETKRLHELRENILATVSHELRTPLTSILGFAETLKERGTDLDEATRAEMVGHLVEQAVKLQRLLSDLLDLDRLRYGLLAPRFRPTDVGALVANVAGHQAGDGHRIDVQAEPIVADVDAAKVERIVENLLANAIKHTPPGTDVLARVERDGAFVLIAVDDRGRGVREDERESVFELFHRGDSYGGAPGTGIGLSLVGQFAAIHGGHAWVEDHPGGGASFRVKLPLNQASKPHRATAAGVG
jgi:signal transduction histidine kinase